VNRILVELTTFPAAASSASETALGMGGRPAKKPLLASHLSER